MNLGPLFVAIAAILWSTDALFRYPIASHLDPLMIVTLEHVICVAVLLPLILVRHRKKVFSLSAQEWLAAFVVGVGASAVATVFFTKSFQLINPTVAILLQKLQPVMVVIIAMIFLGERPAKSFYPWALVAFLAGVLISFPKLEFNFGNSAGSIGVGYALMAAGLWAAGTVIAKVLLKNLRFDLASFWRFFFGLLALLVIDGFYGLRFDFKVFRASQTGFSIVAMSLISGLLAMLAYYAGLARTSASVTTFVELLFPFSAVALNTAILKTPISGVQILAGIFLILAITRISLARQVSRK